MPSVKASQGQQRNCLYVWFWNVTVTPSQTGRNTPSSGYFVPDEAVFCVFKTSCCCPWKCEKTTFILPGKLEINQYNGGNGYENIFPHNPKLLYWEEDFVKRQSRHKVFQGENSKWSCCNFWGQVFQTKVITLLWSLVQWCLLLNLLICLPRQLLCWLELLY